MHSRTKINKRIRTLLLAAAVALVWSVPLAQERDRGQEAQTPEDRQAAEYTRRKLPDDSFTPSEEISEDFPVPFPTDI